MSNLSSRVNPDLYSIAPPPTFLSLAPTTSASYPTNKSRATFDASSTAAPSLEVKKAPSVTSENESAVVEDVTVENAATIIEGIKRDRRTSSMSSNGATGRRFLKLGPIHGDEDHSAVWSDVVE